jgi:hypothetical protein
MCSACSTISVVCRSASITLRSLSNDAPHRRNLGCSTDHAAGIQVDHDSQIGEAFQGANVVSLIYHSRLMILRL